MLSPALLRRAFEAGQPFADYIAHAKPHERAGWDASQARAVLSPAQAELVRSFARRLNVLCLSGTWCGDCVQQVPMLVAIAAARPAGPGERDPGIHLRLLERDAHTDITDAFRICGGRRVPTVIFMNEDFDFVSILGDRTLSRYRAIAERTLGPACPVPGAPIPDDEQHAAQQEWLNEFERVALLLRLSAKLRAQHGD
ncbi:MAG: thioredoxin family protein [Phycisphaerales bacterium]